MSGNPSSSSAASSAPVRGSSSTERADIVPLASSVSTDVIRAKLDECLTRCFYSASGYVFECDPHAVADDDALIQVFGRIREADRRHAHLLGSIIQRRGGVPQPGVFPWWDLDLNFLTVPTLSRFVLETLGEDVALYDALLAAWPGDDLDSKATLAWIRGDKAAQVAELAPVVEAALRREAEATKAAIEVVKKTRTARIAKEKAAAEAAKKAKAAGGGKPVAGAKPAVAAPAPSAALLDSNEPGISKKEKGRRAVMRLRAQHGIATPGSVAPVAAASGVPAPAPSAPAGADIPDPNEPGISPKEKAKRQMLKMRAASAPAPAAAPAPAPVAAAVELLDPNEPGISPKEKAKRQMLKMRAASGAAPAAAPAPAPVPVVEDLGDPDEPGLSPKEKARRKVARMRAQSR